MVIFITLAYMGVGRSTKFIIKFICTGMKFSNLFKKIMPLVLGLIVVFGVMNFGSYDAQNELASFIPTVAMAEVEIPILPPNLPLIQPTNSEPVLRTCDIVASTEEVIAGSNLNISWQTQGFFRVTINDQVVEPTTGGTITFTNIQENSTYTLVATTEDGKSNCVVSVTVRCITPVLLPTCVLTPTNQTINSGESVTLHWSTTNTVRATLSGVGEVPTLGSKVIGPLSTTTTYTLTAYGASGREVTCHSVITVTPPVIPTPTCTLTPTSAMINAGEAVTLAWTTTNATSATLTDFGTVTLFGSRSTGPLLASKNYTLAVLGQNGSTVSCHATITVKETPPVPVCNAFTATPATITKGGSSTLAWTTTNATRVVIDNAIGQVTATGTLLVSPLTTTEYTMTVYGVGVQSVSCKAKVTVNDVPVTPVPKCENFSATPTTLPNGGGNVLLSWLTTNTTGVSISPIIGTVSSSGTTTALISTTTTFTLIASGVNNQSASCAVTVTVLPPIPAPITCANNVNFSANPTTITSGDNATLTWTTNGITAVSFNQGITSTGLRGSVSVSPETTTIYTLTGTAGTSTIACPVTVTVETSGGGGGGSSSPRCEISISKNKINLGDSATLRWDTTRASDIEILDSKNRVIVTTEDLLSTEKGKLFDGSIKVSPTTDTKYTLTAKRGSREKVCTVSIDVENEVVVTQVRDQQPLIAGIALSQVPYTGFEAGPFLTLSFYALLMAWALYIAYVLVIRRDVLGGYALASSHIVAETPTPEEIRPDVFVKSVSTIQMPTISVVPAGLPVADKVIGYEALVEAAKPVGEITDDVATMSTTSSATDEVVTALENYAHAKKALLSSDAIRHFVGTTSSQEERFSALNDVITTAKEKYPAEDGWVVINEKRMRDLCVACSVNQVRSSVAPYVPTVIPEGSGSLAEAIVTGNIVAAYEMIGHRPMFALADAASDLDSVYRSRKGEKMVISDMLMQSTTNLSNEQIMQMIKALTGALDGVYNDEESAVKMAIMKAVKVVA